MRKNSFIFSSNLTKFIFGISSGIFLILIFSLIIIFIIEKSNFRLSRIFSENKLSNFNIFFLGNSRSVSLNKITLENNEVFNISYNSLNYYEVKKILDALEDKNINDSVIYIELTSLIYDNIECRFTIFSNLNHFHHMVSEIHFWDDLDKSKKNKIISVFLEDFGEISDLVDYFNDFNDNLSKKNLNSFLKSVIKT